MTPEGPVARVTCSNLTFIGMAQHLTNKQLAELANKFGTPLYVYHAEKIEAQFSELKKDFAGCDAKFFLCLQGAYQH